MNQPEFLKLNIDHTMIICRIGHVAERARKQRYSDSFLGSIFAGHRVLEVTAAET